MKIEKFIRSCKLGDWFVLYQLSKNLNRPFFMDFLTHLSVHFATGIVCDEEDPDDDSPLMKQMKGLVKPSENGGLLEQMDSFVNGSGIKQGSTCNAAVVDEGDNFLEMILKPKITPDDVDSKNGKKDDDEDDDDKKDESEDKNKTDKKSKNAEKEDERLDLPIGDDFEHAVSSRRSRNDESDSGSNNRGHNTSGKSGGRKGKRI